jgi:HK97 family phage portal protein
MRGLMAALVKDSGTANPQQWLLDWFRGGGEAATSGVVVTPETAMRLGAVFTCVRIRSEDIGKLPCIMYERLPNGGKRRAEHPLFSLIRDRPNPYQTAFEFKQLLQAWVDLRGNGYALKEIDGRGRIVALWPVNPTWVTVLHVPDSWELFYRVSYPHGGTITYPAEAILHLRGMTLDGWTGVSPVTYHRETIGLAIAAQQYGAAFFGNSAQPQGGLKVPHVLDKAAGDVLRASWEQRFKGAKNAKQLAIFDGGMDWVQTGMDNTDAQYLETRKFQNQQIYGIYRMPAHKAGDLERCMPADTLVFTRGGPVRIADIKPGDQVWGPAPRGPKLNRVLNIWENGARDVLAIRTTNRAVRCTDNHHLLVRRAHERPLNPGEVGGRNVGGVKKRIVWRDEYVAASELKPGDTLVTLKSLPSEGAANAPNGRALTVGFMEFCGLLLADGNIQYENGKPRGVSIARSANATYMDAYRSAIKAEFSRYDGGNGRGDVALVARCPVTLTEQERATVFASVVDAASLVDLGFAGTAFTKRVPSWVFGTAENFRLSILRGFLDGDGTVDAKGRITFYSANKCLLDQIRHLCVSCGVPVTNLRFDDQVSQPPGAKAPVSTRMFRFTCSDPAANARIGSHDARYQSRFAGGKSFDRKDRAYPRFGGKESSAPGLGLSRIVSITPEPAETVFDIEVENDHCFFADCVGSHNSTNNNIEHQALEYVTDCLLTEMVRWEQTLKRDLLTEEEQKKYFFEFLPDIILRGDIKSRYEAYAIARNWGWFSVNDIRERENMNGVPNGDIRLQPLNMIEAGTTPPPAAAPAADTSKPPEITPAAAKELIKHLSVIAARGEGAILLNGHGAHDD